MSVTDIVHWCTVTFYVQCFRTLLINSLFLRTDMAPKRKRQQYTDDDLMAAIAEIKTGKSYRKTAHKYGIPVMTLSDKVKGKVPLPSSRPGPSTYLSSNQENRLNKWLLHMGKIGYGKTRKDIPDVVKKILDAAENEGYVIPENRKFVDNRPSKCWVYGFLNRHPRSSARTPENFGFQRANVTEESIRGWFERLEDFLKTEHNLDAKEFLSERNGDRIFNADESGFPLAGTNGKLKIITEKGARTVFKLAPDSKEQITVLACSSASGNFSKPLVIYPGLKCPRFNFHGVNADDFDVGFTQNG